MIDNPLTVCSVTNGVPVTNLPPPSSNYACVGDKMESGSMWLGIAGLMIIGILMSRSFKGSIVIGAARALIRENGMRTSKQSERQKEGVRADCK